MFFLIALAGYFGFGGFLGRQCLTIVHLYEVRTMRARLLFPRENHQPSVSYRDTAAAYALNAWAPDETGYYQLHWMLSWPLFAVWLLLEHIMVWHERRVKRSTA